jgi:hypothetical protein
MELSIRHRIEERKEGEVLEFGNAEVREFLKLDFNGCRRELMERQTSFLMWYRRLACSSGKNKTGETPVPHSFN